MDDVRAVMDAVGSERAALFGHSEGGNMCVLFAATYPERTTALITLGSFAKRRDPDDDYPWAPTADDREESTADVERNWGHFRPEDVEYYAPSRVGDEQFVRNLERVPPARREPRGGRGAPAHELDIDVRHVLPDHPGADARPPPHRRPRRRRRGGPLSGSEDSRARSSSSSPGADHCDLGRRRRRARRRDRGVPDRARGRVPEPDRVLATVLFTDIVGSTEQAAELGDRRWRELLERPRRGRCAASSSASAAARSTRPATASSPTFDGPARAVRCALSAGDAVRAARRRDPRGLHTGECELDGPKIRGIAVHTGARIASLAGPGEVLVSQHGQGSRRRLRPRVRRSRRARAQGRARASGASTPRSEPPPTSIP